jgi:phosphoribosylanthranilate isomerase
MHRTRIKFCGITREKDAAAAAVAGADALGLIFWKQSSRHVTVDQARAVLRSIPAMVCPIGLFVNASVDEIRETAQKLNLRTVQLHGDETPEMVAQLSGLSVIKAIRCDRLTLPSSLQRWRSAVASLEIHHLSGILLETADQFGGSGVENDWAAIESIAGPGQVTGLPPLIAAGGLSPENVASVIRRLRPWAVDVSSGIEQAPGIKSMEKMRRFSAAVREADLSWSA